MNRLLAATVSVVLLLGVACSDDEGNSPQRNNTGDTLEAPTTGGPSSTNP